MPQLNLYLPEDLARAVRAEAKRRRMTLSAYVAGLLRLRLQKTSWKKSFFTDVLGGWKGDFPEVERSPPEEREGL